jgi:hypothetical protein
MRLFLITIVALIVGAAVGYIGPSVVFASEQTESTFPAPDP